MPQYTLAIIEDDPVFRLLSMQALSLEPGLQVLGFSTGEDFLEYANDSGFPELVVIDQKLNSISKQARNGLLICQLIKGKAPDTEVFMCSSVSDPKKIKHFLRQGIAGFVEKNELGISILKQRISRGVRRQNAHPIDEQLMTHARSERNFWGWLVLVMLMALTLLISLVYHQ